MKKLTDEIFNSPDCPEWAEYAFIQYDGTATVVSGDTSGIFLSTLGGPLAWTVELPRGAKTQDLPGVWDTADWQNSLIRRPDAK